MQHTKELYSLPGAFCSRWPHRRHSKACLALVFDVAIMFIPHLGQVGRSKDWLGMLQCILGRSGMRYRTNTGDWQACRLGQIG
jgi:hypothetical protein